LVIAERELSGVSGNLFSPQRISAQPPNQIFNLKPRSERKATADQIISRLRPLLARVPGVTLFL
jgi:hypothetical protein